MFIRDASKGIKLFFKRTRMLSILSIDNFEKISIVNFAKETWEQLKSK